MKRFLLMGCLLMAGLGRAAEPGAPAETRAIPMDQIGVEAQRQYSGDRLSVFATGRFP